MSRYGVGLGLVMGWVAKRKSHLAPAWGQAVYAQVGGSPWAYWAEVLIADELDAHVRAERWAYMRGEVVPSSDVALKVMLERLRALSQEGRNMDHPLPDITEKTDWNP